MKKAIFIVAILALVVSAGGYALSHDLRDGDRGTGWGGHGMMGSGMMGFGAQGMGMQGHQGGTPVNPETQQPYTEDEWNQAAQQMHNTCGAFMGYNQVTDE